MGVQTSGVDLRASSATAGGCQSQRRRKSGTNTFERGANLLAGQEMQAGNSARRLWGDEVIKSSLFIDTFSTITVVYQSLHHFQDRRSN